MVYSIVFILIKLPNFFTHSLRIAIKMYQRFLKEQTVDLIYINQEFIQNWCFILVSILY
jgi:hypothetical protein